MNRLTKSINGLKNWYFNISTKQRIIIWVVSILLLIILLLTARQPVEIIIVFLLSLPLTYLEYKRK